uniref:Uncharacterized protein n=1 Tax=Parascaris equorum TaxID=6256 RepID=A0A914RP75_PAREQ
MKKSKGLLVTSSLKNQRNKAKSSMCHYRNSSFPSQHSLEQLDFSMEVIRAEEGDETSVAIQMETKIKHIKHTCS